MQIPIIARDNLLFLKKPLRSRDLPAKISPDGKSLAGISRDPDVLEVWVLLADWDNPEVILQSVQVSVK